MSISRILKYVAAILAAILVFFLLAFLLGSSESEAASNTGSFCAKYASHPACKPENRIASVETVTVRKVKASEAYPQCFTVAKRRKYRNDLKILLFWVQIDQVMCPDKKKRRIAQVLPAVESTYVSPFGVVIGFKVSDGRISSGPMPWRGHPKGSYRSEAVFGVVQEPCVPVINACQKLRQFSYRLWIRGFADGTSAWGTR